MVRWLLLPGAPLSTPHYADPHAPLSRIVLHAGGIDAAMGDGVGIVGFERGELQAQLGVEAGLFMGFLPGGELTFHLQTFDGIFAFPLDLRLGDAELRLRWAHVSAHFADGIRASGYQPTAEQLDPFSREWLAAEGGYTWRGLHPYARASWILHAIDGGGGAWLQGGLQGDWPGAAFGQVGPYFALDLAAAAEQGWTLNQSVEAGVRLGPPDKRPLRIAAAGYRGRSRAGKLWGDAEEVSYVGLKLTFE